MPWWNAQRRKELAEKKEAEQRKKEEERRQQEKMLEEEKEAMLLEERMHRESKEIKHLNENDDLGEEKRHQDEELSVEQADSGKLQINERDTIGSFVGKDLQNKKIHGENISKMSIEEKHTDADKKIISKNKIEIKKVPSDNRRNIIPVHQVVNNQVCVKQDLNQIDIPGTSLNQDDQNSKRGKQCNVKNQIEIKKDKLNKESTKQKNVKQNSDATKHENNKKNCLNDKCIKIENKDVVKLNNFDSNDIIKTHTGSQSKNKIISVND